MGNRESSSNDSGDCVWCGRNTDRMCIEDGCYQYVCEDCRDNMKRFGCKSHPAVKLTVRPYLVNDFRPSTERKISYHQQPPSDYEQKSPGRDVCGWASGGLRGINAFINIGSTYPHHQEKPTSSFKPDVINVEPNWKK